MMRRISKLVATALCFSGIVATGVSAKDRHHAGQLKGNSECWGKPSAGLEALDRQDISCRALTEKFLLSMEGATREEVIEAMGVKGRDAYEGKALHFISNYSMGEAWGSGVVNFTFDEDGKASIIEADIDAPASSGLPHVDFLWNRDLQYICSGLPGSSLKPCD